jgi:pyrroline-5-carboxylate reductase
MVVTCYYQEIIHKKKLIMKKSIGFIGGGRVTRILLQSFLNRNVQFSKVVVTEPNKDTAEKLKIGFPHIQTGDLTAAASQDIVFISLHPPVLMDTLEQIKSVLKSSTVLISLAPKITISRISSKVENVKNIVRLIPNATSYINEGYNPVTFSPEFDAEEKKNILSLLQVMGNTFEVKEEKLESYAIMSAMLPTYFWFQWNELTEIGTKIGLTEEEAKKSINDTMIAALNLMFKSGLTPAEVIDLIPVKPIGENEPQITEIYNTKLIGLFEKIKP